MIAGRYEVVAVRYGSRTARRSETYLNHHLYGEPDAAVEMEYFFWVVRDRTQPDDVVVVDCGFAPDVGRRRGRTVLADPIEALAALGVDAAHVRRLVVTHAHYDHIGNLERFPAAEIVVARRELDFWTGPLAGRLQFAHATEADELAELARAAEQGRVRTVDDRLELGPGFELVVVGGHTPGQMIALVEVDGDEHPGTAVLAADALHFYDELERDQPFFVVADLADMYIGFDVLRDLAERPGHVLVAGHDASVGARFPGRVPGTGQDDIMIRIDATGGARPPVDQVGGRS